MLFVRGKLDGVGHYRCSIPYLALKDAGHSCDILDNKARLRACAAWFADYDFVILQKINDPGWYDLISVIPGDRRPFTVWECDDLVTGLTPDNPSYKDYHPHEEGFRQCAQLADGIIVSTCRLAEHFDKLNANCAVVPNYLDIPGFREWAIPETRTDRRLYIGWLGGVHHFGDWKPIGNVIRWACYASKDVAFAYCGNKQLGRHWKQKMGVPDGQWVELPTGEFDGYQTRISQFDIGVAPLERTEFNSCKSDLRLLEYGAWGVPYVASNVAPYSSFHLATGGMGGYIARNEDEWNLALKRLIDSRPERIERGNDLREYVRTARGKEACAVRWSDALEGLRNARELCRSPLALPRGVCAGETENVRP